MLPCYEIVQACSAGNVKIVELLLEEGAEKDTLSRWNVSPFQEAVNNRSLTYSRFPVPVSNLSCPYTESLSRAGKVQSLSCSFNVRQT